MLNKILITLISLVAFALVPNLVLAMQEGPPPTHYVFLLNNLDGIVRQQEYRAPVPYEFFYEEEGVISGGNQKGVLTDLNNKDLVEFYYDLKQGNFEVYVPYFTNAGRVRLFDQNNKEIYSYDLGEIAVCDFDKKCGSLVGETELSCPSDCAAGAIAEQNSEAKTVSNFFGALIVVLVVIGGGLLGVIIYLIHKGLKGK